MFQKLYRRVILKHFGSTKNFIVWSLAVILTIYVIDSFILTRDRLDSIVGSQNGVQNMGQHGMPTDDKDKAHKNEEKKQEEKKPEKPEIPGKCGLKKACGADEVAYFLSNGVGRDGKPVICWNGEYVFSDNKQTGKRGINMAVINEKTKAVEEFRNFDTYSEGRTGHLGDDSFKRFMRLGVTGNQIILLASMDDMANRLSQEGKDWLHIMGAGTKLDQLVFRDGYLLVGQRGLSKGSGVEEIAKRDDNEFADTVELKGCLKIPIGTLGEVKPPVAAAPAPVPGEGVQGPAKPAEQLPGLKAGEEAPSCGVKESCGPDAFPAHLFTGKGNSEGPKICVSGKYVLATGLNDGGRGVNIVIVNPKTKDVVRVGHFDTYSEDSSNLEIFLEMINEGEIILAATHDDASKKLSDHAKKLLNELGSGLIQNIQFRDIWVLVGQKGIDGFGYIEQLEARIDGTDYPLPIDKRLCIPTKIKGSKIKPDPLANKNEARRKFCGKYDGYGEFCIAEHVDEPLIPAPLTHKSLEGHAVFKVPIIVIPGLNHNAVRMQLETLLLNPGIDPSMVTVMFDEKFTEPAALAEIFKFKGEKLTSSTKYVVQMQKALDKAWELYPKADYVIILEEEVIVGMDLLYFFAQLLPALEKDDSLIGVSGWNVNGYKESSGIPSAVYRTATFPGLGFLLKKSFYEKAIKGNQQSCCTKRSWHGWFSEATLDGKEMLVPDVSRVYRRPYEGLSEEGDLLTELFNRERITNLDSKAELSSTDKLTKDAYNTYLTGLLKSSSALDTANVEDCLTGRGLGFYIPQTTGKSYVIYMEQQSSSDYDIMSRLCACFGLFHIKDHPPRGLHQGTLRFSYKGNDMIFVGSKSSYYDNRPASYRPISRSQL